MTDSTQPDPAPTGAVPPSQPDNAKRTRVWLIAALSALVVAVIVLVGVLSYQAGASSPRSDRPGISQAGPGRHVAPGNRPPGVQPGNWRQNQAPGTRPGRPGAAPATAPGAVPTTAPSAAPATAPSTPR